MPGQQGVSSTWSKPSHRDNRDCGTIFPLDLKLGPYRLGRVDLNLTMIDLGRTAISGEEVDVRSLPSDRALFLKSVPERLALKSSDIIESMPVYRL